MKGDTLKAPFPYFGGKRRVADLVWSRLGDVRNYVEPFAGSLAVLLCRPTPAGIETVNDFDCYIANFWRALTADPEAVAQHADWPVNEADQHARHLWLVSQAAFRERMQTDPDYYDAKVAGWWVWEQSMWIGAGWCAARPHLGDAGTGVHRQLPHLGNAGRGSHRQSQELYGYFEALSARLRRVRVCCGDWSRICGPTPTFHNGLTGVFLDPPYGNTRTARLYASDDLTVAEAVCRWALEHGDDPNMRIALCGYEGEYDLPDTWSCVAWKAAGGYGSQGNGRGRSNAGRERIWFSPHCLNSDAAQPATERALVAA